MTTLRQARPFLDDDDRSGDIPLRFPERPKQQAPGGKRGSLILFVLLSLALAGLIAALLGNMSSVPSL